MLGLGHRLRRPLVHRRANLWTYIFLMMHVYSNITTAYSYHISYHKKKLYINVNFVDLWLLYDDIWKLLCFYFSALFRSGRLKGLLFWNVRHNDDLEGGRGGDTSQNFHIDFAVYHHIDEAFGRYRFISLHAGCTMGPPSPRPAW